MILVIIIVLMPLVLEGLALWCAWDHQLALMFALVAIQLVVAYQIQRGASDAEGRN